MASQPWFRELPARLASQGLPRHYVQRLRRVALATHARPVAGARLNQRGDSGVRREEERSCHGCLLSLSQESAINNSLDEHSMRT